MVDWWFWLFWWHSVESERCALWYPYNHVYAYSSCSKPAKGGGKAPRAFNDALSHRDRWLGSAHTVKEFIGPQFMTIRTEFKDSSPFGLPWEELQKAGYESAVCAVLWDAKLPMKVGEFVHLWRRKEGDEGLELRRRY